MKQINSIIHRLLQRGFGIDVVRHRPFVAQPEATTIDRRRTALLSHLKVDVLLDVGANTGQYASGVRRNGYPGKVISFEPISSTFKQLSNQRGADPQWDLQPYGLGASAGSVTINVAGNNAESSSILAMKERHITEAPYAMYVGQEAIRLETLDNVGRDLFRPTDRLWLKIDTQGYEMPVLEGAQRTLSQVWGMEVELSLVSLYEGQPLLREALGKIEALGFQLIGCEEVFADSTSMRTLQLNGIFERA